MENLVGRVVLIAAGGTLCVLRRAVEGEWDGFRLVYRVKPDERDFFRGHVRDAVRVKDEIEVRALAAMYRGEEILARSGTEDVFKQAQIEVAVEPAEVERAPWPITEPSA